MSLKYTHNIRTIAGWTTVALGIACVAVVAVGYMRHDPAQELAARLLPAHIRGETPWKTLSATDITEGVTAPSHTNVILHLPNDMKRITRRTLFGRAGQTARYWGYCFPVTEQEDNPVTIGASPLPGKLFLSEKERETILGKANNERRKAFAITHQLTDEDFDESRIIQGTIRHQKEIFWPGETCYLMTEQPLSVGIDDDKDAANTKVETIHKTDPELADSDNDGIVDGIEIFSLGTLPNSRDTDGDGLIDGIEDANGNGRTEANESSPTMKDSDRDELCDGLCRERRGRDYVLVGEDRNLNGELDENETSPVLADTDGDGILDEQEFFGCILAGKSGC